jgi:hypothetical protein
LELLGRNVDLPREVLHPLHDLMIYASSLVAVCQ